jgi:aminopeptidase N
MWIEATRGEDAYRQAVQDAYSAMSGVAHPLPGDPGPADLFADSVYQRGGLTLAALRAEIGDEAFEESLRVYAGRYAYSNASTADFATVVQEVSGTDVTGLLHSWLFDEEMPEFFLD